MLKFSRFFIAPFLIIGLINSKDPKTSNTTEKEQKQIINNYYHAPYYNNNQTHDGIHLSSKMDNSQYLKNIQSMAAVFKQHVSDFAKNLPALIEDLKKSSKEIIFPSLIKHKKKIIFFTIAGILFYATHKIQKTKNILNDQSSWSNWKQTISIQHLTSIPYKELIPELLTDIQKKYLLDTGITPSNANQISLPYDNFTTEIKSEINDLICYVRIHDEIKRFKLTRFFFFPYEKEVINEKINRLRAILNIFASWQVETFLKQNK